MTPSSADFRELYDGTFDQVYAYLYHRCGGVQPVAEDLTQETYLAAVKTFKAGTGEALSLPWLIGVARHKLVDHYRRREREERRLSLIVNEETRQASAGQEGERDRERAREALGSVPAEQRAALILKYLDGLAVAEIAEILGRSVHATESLLSRGRRSLRRRFQEVADD